MMEVNIRESSTPGKAMNVEFENQVQREMEEAASDPAGKTIRVLAKNLFQRCYRPFRAGMFGGGGLEGSLFFSRCFFFNFCRFRLFFFSFLGSLLFNAGYLARHFFYEQVVDLDDVLPQALGTSFGIPTTNAFNGLFHQVLDKLPFLGGELRVFRVVDIHGHAGAMVAERA